MAEEAPELIRVDRPGELDPLDAGLHQSSAPLPPLQCVHRLVAEEDLAGEEGELQLGRECLKLSAGVRLRSPSERADAGCSSPYSALVERTWEKAVRKRTGSLMRQSSSRRPERRVRVMQRPVEHRRGHRLVGPVAGQGGHCSEQLGRLRSEAATQPEAPLEGERQRAPAVPAGARVRARMRTAATRSSELRVDQRRFARPAARPPAGTSRARAESAKPDDARILIAQAGEYSQRIVLPANRAAA